MYIGAKFFLLTLLFLSYVNIRSIVFFFLSLIFFSLSFFSYLLMQIYNLICTHSFYRTICVCVYVCVRPRAHVHMYQWTTFKLETHTHAVFKSKRRAWVYFDHANVVFLLKEISYLHDREQIFQYYHSVLSITLK